MKQPENTRDQTGIVSEIAPPEQGGSAVRPAGTIRNWPGILSDIVRGRAILFVLITVFILMSMLKPNTFLSVRNLTNVLRQVTVLGILACGMTMVLISGNFDLSVGSNYSLCMVLPMLLQPKGLFLAIAVTLLAGIVVGLVNGIFVGKFKANAFIITLGMLSIIQGLAFMVTNGRNIPGDPDSPYSLIGGGVVLGIPVPVYILVSIALISHFLLCKTTFGRSIYVTGGNEYAALSSGINTGNVRMVTFMILGFLCAIGGIITSSLLANGTPYGGKGYEFDVITAALLGGTSLFGGKGTIFNTLTGVLLLGVIANSMILLRFPFNFQQIVKGVILISAVYYDMISSQGSRS
jgi:ribose/xylose/arabinose/galactoside ABC-type transport system permease subunit